MAIERAEGTTRAEDVLASIDVPRELLVGGEWVQARSGDRLTVTDPSTGRPVTDVAGAGEEDIEAAVAAAQAAFDDGA